MITVEALTCGGVMVDRAVPNRGVSKNGLAYTGLFRSEKERITLPVKTFLIRHPKGNILVDTAWDSDVRTHPIRTITFPMWFASKPLLPPGQAVDEQLFSRGLLPKNLDLVLMTHMDIDHDSGLRLVKNAGHIFVSPAELAAIHSGQVRYVKRPWKNIPLTSMPLEKDESAPYGLSWDVFGDKSVKVLSLPGHSQGSVALLVSGGKQFLLIAGDTGYNRASFEKLNLPGPVYDKIKMKKSLTWVAEQRKRPDCIAVLTAHDPEEKRTVFKLEESL